MTKERLEAILEKHRKWLNNKECGECANLTGANLARVDLIMCKKEMQWGSKL